MQTLKFPMRLDRLVSQALGCSRSEARMQIKRGAVRVAGNAAVTAASRIAADDAVTVDGRPLALPRPLYLMLHKPCGLLSATRDDRQATVLSLLPAELARRVHLAGRLDKDTSGLLLLSDDGDWTHRVTSPRHRCAKVYRADLAEPLAEAAVQRLENGLLLRGETRPTLPARVDRVDASRVRITVFEGRYHLVRRLFAAVGNHVVALHRERIGGVSLDPRLPPGEWRELTAQERGDVLDRALPD
jgi:16S rRNA pseudouridine516 synthase